MATKKKVKKPEVTQHKKRVLAIIPVLIMGLLYTALIGPLVEGGIFLDIVAGVLLGSFVGGLLAYQNTTDDGVLDNKEKQEAITTGMLLFVGLVSLLLFSNFYPGLKQDKLTKTLKLVFQKEGFERLLWNLLYLVLGYLATFFILAKSVPTIGRKLGKLEEDEEDEEEKEEEDPAAAAAATGTAAPGSAGATTTAESKKKKEKSGSWIAVVGGVVLFLVIISTLMNSGSSSDKDDAAAKETDKPKTENTEKKRSPKKTELDPEFAKKLRENGEKEPEAFSVDSEEEPTAETEETFGQ